MEDRLMTVAETADYLNVKISWVYDQWRDKEIPFKKVGQGLRVRRTELDTWLDSQAA